MARAARTATAVQWQWALSSDWRDFSDLHTAQLESLYEAIGESAIVQLEIGGVSYLVAHDGDHWVQQRMDNADVWRTVRRVSRDGDEPGPKRARSSSPIVLDLKSDEEEPAEEAEDELVEEGEEDEKAESDATNDDERAVAPPPQQQRAHSPAQGAFTTAPPRVAQTGWHVRLNGRWKPYTPMAQIEIECAWRRSQPSEPNVADRQAWY